MDIFSLGILISFMLIKYKRCIPFSRDLKFSSSLTSDGKLFQILGNNSRQVNQSDSQRQQPQENRLPKTMETLSGQHGVTWLLTDIQDGVITSSTNLVAHGDIQKWQGGLKLDGTSSWIEVKMIEGIFILF